LKDDDIRINYNLYVMILFAEYKFKIRSSKKGDLTVYNYIVM
jgi:hypothetical protein